MQQINKLNTWKGTYPTGKFAAKNDNYSTTNHGNQFLVTGGLSTQFWPNNNRIDPPQLPKSALNSYTPANTWFSFYSNSTAEPLCTGRVAGDGFIAEQQLKEAVINQDLTFEEAFADALAWKTEQDIYAKLMEHPELIEEYSDEAAFVAAKEQETMADFIEVEKKKAAALNPSEANKLLYSQKIDAIHLVADQIQTQEEQLRISTDPLQISYLETTIANLWQNYDNIKQQIQVIEQAMQEDRIAAIDLAEIKNQSIVPNNRILEINQKVANEIYFSTFKEDFMAFDTPQWQNLSVIAHQCPVIGGKAVYLARSLYSQYDMEIYDDNQICAQAGILFRTKKANEKLSTNSLVKFYPNPNNGIMYIAVEKKEEAQYTLKIRSLQGTEIINTSIGFYDGRTKINVGELSSGMYIVQLCKNGELIASEKISIIK